MIKWFWTFWRRQSDVRNIYSIYRNSKSTPFRFRWMNERRVIRKQCISGDINEWNRMLENSLLHWTRRDFISKNNEFFMGCGWELVMNSNMLSKLSNGCVVTCYNLTRLIEIQSLHNRVNRKNGQTHRNKPRECTVSMN